MTPYFSSNQSRRRDARRWLLPASLGIAFAFSSWGALAAILGGMATAVLFLAFMPTEAKRTQFVRHQ